MNESAEGEEKKTDATLLTVSEASEGTRRNGAFDKSCALVGFFIPEEPTS